MCAAFANDAKECGTRKTESNSQSKRTSTSMTIHNGGNIRFHAYQSQHRMNNMQTLLKRAPPAGAQQVIGSTVDQSFGGEQESIEPFVSC